MILLLEVRNGSGVPIRVSRKLPLVVHPRRDSYFTGSIAKVRQVPGHNCPSPGTAISGRFRRQLSLDPPNLVVSTQAEAGSRSPMRATSSASTLVLCPQVVELLPPAASPDLATKATSIPGLDEVGALAKHALASAEKRSLPLVETSTTGA